MSVVMATGQPFTTNRSQYIEQIVVLDPKNVNTAIQDGTKQAILKTALIRSHNFDENSSGKTRAWIKYVSTILATLSTEIPRKLIAQNISM